MCLLGIKSHAHDEFSHLLLAIELMNYECVFEVGILILANPI